MIAPHRMTKFPSDVGSVTIRNVDVACNEKRAVVFNQLLSQASKGSYHPAVPPALLAIAAHFVY